MQALIGGGEPGNEATSCHTIIDTAKLALSPPPKGPGDEVTAKHEYYIVSVLLFGIVQIPTLLQLRALLCRIRN